MLFINRNQIVLDAVFAELKLIFSILNNARKVFSTDVPTEQFVYNSNRFVEDLEVLEDLADQAHRTALQEPLRCWWFNETNVRCKALRDRSHALLKEAQSFMRAVQIQQVRRYYKNRKVE